MNTDRDHNITYRQTEIVYANATTGAIFGALVAIVLAAASYLIESGLQSFFWLLSVLLTFVAYVCLTSGYFADPERRERDAYWYRALLVLSIASGCLWGLSAWLLFAGGGIVLKFFLYTVLASITAVNVSIFSPRYSIYIAFCLPTLTLTALETTRHDDFVMVFGGFICLLGPVLAKVAWRYYRDVRSMCRLHAENADLKDELESIAEKNNKSRNREQSLNTVLDDAGVMTWRTDASGNFTAISSKLLQLLAAPATDFLGQPLTSMLQMKNTGAGPRTNVDLAIGQASPFRDIQCEVLATNDKTVTLAISGKPITVSGEFVGYEGYFRDVTIEQALLSRLTHQAQHDSITGLINHAQFLELVNEMLPPVVNRSGRLHVLYLDVKNLKIVNDTLGLAVGDKMLGQLAKLLDQTIGQSGTVARLGGGFGVILKPCDIQTALQTSKQALAALNNFRLTEGEMIFSIQACAGIVAVEMTMETAEDVMICADLACRHADLHAETPAAVYQTGMRDEAGVSESEQLAILTSDLENNRLQLQFQPIVNLQTGKTVWLEALLSNYGSDGTLKLVGKTLMAAERHGIVWRFDRWVINESIRLLAKNPTVANDGVLINVSPQTLQHQEFATYVLQRLREHDVRPNNICFNVTGGALAREWQTASDNLMRLARRGCRVSLDDFGTGSGSMQSLRELPANYLKINHVFLDGLETNDMDQVICSSIVKLAERSGCEVIAESIQDPAKSALLQKFGIHLAQGYAFGAPTTLSEIARNATAKARSTDNNIVSLHGNLPGQDTAKARKSR